MDTPQIFQRRLQAFLRRYDLLAKAVGPLKAPQPNEISREVAGLLLLSAKQCCIAASIIDTAENVAITGPAPVVRVRQLAHAHTTNRRGNLVVVHGTGKDTFPFPDVNSLVLNALTRLSGGGEDKRAGKGDHDDLLNSTPTERITYVVGAMELDSIVRVPADEGIDSTNQPGKTPSRDLLNGHTTQPQVCFLRDAERLVEQIPTRDGMYVLEFEVGPEDFLPDVLLERASGFLDRAEEILSAAEALWPNSQPPVDSAVALPKEEQRYTTSAS
ncbi:hypothetical protein BH10CYA1_BH10CYA1_37840 [soil metagenome]